MHGPFSSDEDDVLIRIKAVPGGSRDALAGLLGDRLKVRVSAPAEGGRANDAIRRLLAGALGVAARNVTIESGSSSPLKTVRVLDCTVDRAEKLAGG